MRKKLIAALLCFVLLCPVGTAAVKGADRVYTVAEVESLCDGIVAFKEAQCGAYSAQDWLDTGLCADAGITAEYYAITLSQSGYYDMSAYGSALLGYLESHSVYSATTREKYALALIACGSTDSYIRQVCDNDIGGLGLMSLIFGLHLLNNGYTSAMYSSGSLISEILGCQLSDGGWAVIGDSGDVDVTAMAIQALAPHYGSVYGVAGAVDSALGLLSSLQLESGGFRSMGAENCESAAQVLTALSALGIDQSYDTRFIKNSNTVLGAMLSYRNSDGSFAHTGSGFNENATIQAFYSMRAYLRMCYGQSPYYILDRRSPDQLKPSKTAEVTEAPRKSSGGTNSDGTNSGEAQPELIYIDGRAYIEATNSAGEIVTVAAETAAPRGTEPYHGEYTAPTGNSVFQPTGTASAASTPDEIPSKKGGYKLYAVLIILAAALIICAALYLKKKRNIKNYLAVIIIACALIAAVMLTNIESKESYSRPTEKTEAVGAVTLSISCDILSGESDLPLYVPEGGAILSETSFDIAEGDTVYDILLEASRRYGIQIDNRGGEGSAYIAGIQYLYEFDYGSLSGWMYRVNGEFPEVGCQSCTLSDGDRIEWLYTKNIGKDL